MPLHEKAFAKINLCLHVTGRRADGYHLLESLVAFADCHDLVTAEPAEDFSLEISGPFAPMIAMDDSNLVIRAAHALAARAGIAARAKLRLTKRLPVGAGIGGGSADAAAALRLLSRLWEINLPPEAMHSLALSLGADVPVCLASRTSFMRGIGEAVEAGPALPPWSLLLVNPREPLPTAQVFGQLGGAYDAPLAPLRAGDDPLAWLQSCGNSLQAPARRVKPVIGEMLRALETFPGCAFARMSGSGATCFGLFEEAKQAREAAGQLQACHSGWWITVASMVV